MFKRLHTLFAWMCVFIVMALPLSVRATTAADYKTAEYYRNAGLDFINAADAYALGYTGKGIIVALFDDPVSFYHREFLGKDYLKSYLCEPIRDWSNYSHGTHVAGIMAANKDNFGMHGVAFDAGVVSLGEYTFSSVVPVLYPQIFNDNSIKIINNSWGSQLYPEYELNFKSFVNNFVSPEEQVVFQQAVLNHDKVLVWAVGNSGHLSASVYPNMGYIEPKLNENMINVIAFDPSKKADDIDFLAVFSDHALFVEENSIAAPGIGIYSTVPSDNGGTYEKKDGTSQAAPHVSGVLGLVQQAFPYMGGKEMVDTVLSTANNSFNLPRYTVILQDELNRMTGDTQSNSLYIVYFDDSGRDLNQRIQDLRDYYARSQDMQRCFGSVENFLEAYYYGFPPDANVPYYGSDRYYLNVPREIMFGQGLLDAGKAVRGPGLFNARRLTDNDYSDEYNGKNQALYTINTQGYNSVWSNDIGEKKVEKYSGEYLEFYKDLYGGFFEMGLYGQMRTYAEGAIYGEEYYDSLNTEIVNNKLYELPVGLRKTGEGILALTGNNTYQGDNIVTGGTLQIDGTVTANVYGEKGGTVAGSGTIGQNLISSGGTVQPGSWGAVGSLTVNGDFNSDGVIKIAAQNNTSSELIIKGNADVDGSTVTASGLAAPNVNYQFLSANGGISGNLYGVEFSPFLKTNPSHDGSKASFQVDKYADLNSLANLNWSQMASANALENMYRFMGTAGQLWPDELLAVYNIPTTAGARVALQEIYGSTQVSLASSLPLREQFGQIINSRFSSLKWNDNPTENNEWWVKFIDGGKTVNADSELGLAKMKPQRSGFITGYDKKINQSWRLGTMFGYGRGKLFTQNARGDSQDRRLGLYGSYNTQAFDLNIYLAAGRQSHDTERSINLPLTPLAANSKYNGTTWETGVRAKYNLHHDREKSWHIAPYAALDVERYSQDGYSENGAGVLSQQGEKMLNIYSTAGFGLEASRKINKGHYLVTAGYKRILSGGNPEIKVNFRGSPQDKFTSKSNRESRDWLVLGFNAEGELAKNWTVSAALQGEFSDRGNNRSASITFNRYL